MVSGLGALGFWLFISAVVVAGIWYAIRDREAQHATLRSMIENGQTADAALLEGLLSNGGGAGGLDRHLMMYGLIILFLAIGLALFGLILSLQAAIWLYPLLGASVLTACAAIGLIAASKVVKGPDR